LERDVQKRLVDPEVLKKHPYFASIDWEKLNRLEITPPFVPAVKGAMSPQVAQPTLPQSLPVGR
jgi:hypothetical protein